MAWLQIHGEYHDLLAHYELRSFDDFFRLPGGRIVRDPPNRPRSVVRFEIDGVGYFLKREKVVPWRDRLRYWLSGAGLVSKSRHEWHMLQRMLLLGMNCPEPVAVGESGSEAFLLLKELTGYVDLKTYLANAPRPEWPTKLGHYLCQLHETGFLHRDLFASHIFVNPCTLEMAVIDLQRCLHRRQMTWQQRGRDLAPLHASLAPALVPHADRLRFLQSYLDVSGVGPSIRIRSRLLADIEGRSRYLLRRRKFQEMRMNTPQVFLSSFAVADDELEHTRSQRREALNFPRDGTAVLQKGADA